MIYVGRTIYLGIVLLGVLINTDEYRRARWVSQALVAQKVNGLRQMVARHLTCVAGLLLLIQALLVVPAVAAFIVPRRIAVQMDDWIRMFLILAQWSHITMVLLLTRLAFLNRRHREHLIAASDAEAHDRP
jgi:hypothetical protein